MNHIIKKIKSEIPSSIKIIAITKNIPTHKIIPLLESGHRYFGESKIQEAEEKWIPLKEQYPDIKLHLIGHLQTNKVRKALELFDIIETIDSFKLANKIATELKIPKEFFVQINIGKESQKSGIDPINAKELIDHCRKNLSMNIKGVMTIPPLNKNSAPYFTELKEIADKNNLSEISMGMSSDYKEAIKCGATQVRLGKILFS